MASDTAVEADGRVVLLLPKPPNRAATSGDADVSEVVLAGAAEADLGSVTSSAGRANGAYVVPLAHRATVRVAVPLASTDLRQLPPVPTAEQVANGWKVHGERGLRFVLPDEPLQSAVDSLRRSLLFRWDAPAVPVSVAGALDVYGYAGEAAELLASDPEGAGIGALAGHWRRHRDDALARAVVEDVAVLADELPKGSPELLDAAVLLEAAGESQAAASARNLAGAPVDRPAPAWPDVAPNPWTWPIDEAARFLVVVRDLLVRESADGLLLLGSVPDEWYGRGVEVHDAPTAFGPVSYGIRWHGDRPALLWDVEPADGPVRLRIGLDPTWLTDEPRGEALLAPVLPPGTSVSLRRR
jgi:hypothetical protein